MIKKIVLSLSLFALLSADEVDRIEKIVKDISELRKSYDICENELYVLKQTQGDDAQKSKIYESEIAAQTDLFDRETTKLKSENRALKNKITHLKELLKEKSQPQANNIEISALQDTISEQAEEISVLTQASKEKCKPVTKIVHKKIDDNPFPKLMSKDEKPAVKTIKIVEKEALRKEVIKEEITRVEALPKQTVIKEETFAPSSFRLIVQSNIYDEYEGNIIDKWDEQTSFTSNIRKGDWIKITGYFIEGKWKSAGTKVMWIEGKDIIKR